jgi:hypothetical protein
VKRFIAAAICLKDIVVGANFGAECLIARGVFARLYLESLEKKRKFSFPAWRRFPPL